MIILCDKLQKQFFNKEENKKASEALSELIKEFNENAGKSLYNMANKATGKINNRMAAWVLCLSVTGAAIGGAIICFLNRYKKSDDSQKMYKNRK